MCINRERIDGVTTRGRRWPVAINIAMVDETHFGVEKRVGARTQDYRFIMINALHEERKGGCTTTTRRRCIYLSMRANDREWWGTREGQTGNARVRFQDGPGPGGCCARVRINLRLLVKICALSFHLCVRARGFVRSFARSASSIRVASVAVWVGHLHEM